jgi:hypothetical protein
MFSQNGRIGKQKEFIDPIRDSGERPGLTASEGELD